jgi:uncharacterized Zn ribbon protein
MESKIEQRIKSSGNSVEEYNSIYRDILSLKSDASKKDQLLSLLKRRSFANGIDLSNLIIPKIPMANRLKVSLTNSGSKGTKKDDFSAEEKEGVSSIEVKSENSVFNFSQLASADDYAQDHREHEFLSKQISIIRDNFPFLELFLLKDGIQIEAFKTVTICCDEISVDYLNTYFVEYRHQYISCRDFSRGNFETTGSYIIILFWPQNIQNNLPVIDRIKDIANIKYLDMKAFERKDVYWRGVTYFEDSIKDYLSISYQLPIINTSLLPDQEKLVRKAVRSPTGFLTYKVLTGGYTEALVLEVTSVGNGNARKKFVLKIAYRNKAWDTISQEFRNFQEYIENMDLGEGTSVSAQMFECGEFEAIKYPFASKHSLGNSESLGQFLKNADTFEAIKDVIVKSFNTSLMVKWCKTDSKKKINLYDAFKKLDYKIDGFQRMREHQKEFNYAQDFDFEKLNSYFNNESDTVYCIAHGDFHVENVRVDTSDTDREVFFIDFGKTGHYPMGIDHAALECSIRYGTLDSAFLLEELIKYDDVYFSVFAEILNPKKDGISKVNYSISLIRQDYINKFPNEHRSLAEAQYFHCLFAVSSWLMNKPNLNRRYIWNVLVRIYRDKFEIK